MNTLAKLRRLLTAVKWRRSVPRDRFGPSTVQEAGDRTIPLTAPAGVAAAGEITFTPSFAPFKPVRKNAEWVEKKQQQEWEEFGCVLTPDTYPHG
ncbi:MAG: hypothetical protein NTW28_10340, partial [Candidatus Solibacter sp.]|nr:hypothetical protein [Candidatus Solibacter sp.]